MCTSNLILNGYAVSKSCDWVGWCDHMEIASGACSSSMRRRSLSISSHQNINIDNDNADCESVSEAGDIGDRALPSKRFSESNNSISLSFDENGEEQRWHSHPSSSVRPLPPQLTSPSPLSTDAILASILNT
ncbi:hypothetical protein RIF29_05356 [Crotalaria pallida]|uniref:Uncharacterized protein n=1 Tax=Crotalaria pallida TaxID=3830 RepID=A0AAN9J1Y1_CROPI